MVHQDEWGKGLWTVQKLSFRVWDNMKDKSNVIILIIDLNWAFYWNHFIDNTLTHLKIIETHFSRKRARIWVLIISYRINPNKKKKRLEIAKERRVWISEGTKGRRSQLLSAQLHGLHKEHCGESVCHLTEIGTIRSDVTYHSDLRVVIINST